jgi:SAM-dependent methyltransferase
MRLEIQNNKIEQICPFCKNKINITICSVKDAPLLLGCTEKKYVEDSFMDYDILQCRNCKLVFTNANLNEIAYSIVHSESIGRTWEEHHESFKKFVGKEQSDLILEIGPSNNPISRENTVFIDMFNECAFKLKPNEKYYKNRFPDFDTVDRFDKIIASHVFEHTTNPRLFLQKCKEILSTNGRIFLSIPNFLLWINEKYWNGITPEHQIYPTIYQVKILCDSLNLSLRIEYFKNHSVFLEIRKGIDSNKFRSEKDGVRIKEWCSSINNSISIIESELIKRDVKSMFLVGASHISQYPLLISDEVKKRTKFVLDNSKSKHEKRLYGTKIMCKPFEILSDYEAPTVVMFNSPYYKEIATQIISINQKSEIISDKV